MTDFLNEKSAEIEARLKDLRPLVDEHHRLEQAAAALAGVAATDGRSRSRRRAGVSGRSGGRRGRPRGSGSRSIQALELVRARPGISVRELAEAMQVQVNYLYRVMPALKADGKVVRRDGGWHPA